MLVKTRWNLYQSNLERKSQNIKYAIPVVLYLGKYDQYTMDRLRVDLDYE